jgi:hypothetical protein
VLRIPIDGRAEELGSSGREISYSGFILEGLVGALTSASRVELRP